MGVWVVGGPYTWGCKCVGGPFIWGRGWWVVPIWLGLVTSAP